MQQEFWLPLAFVGVMGFAMLIYAILDGYDLGVGMLIKYADDDEKNIMIASIGPFWDANETWLVMGTGVLLFAFPTAHGIILTALYIPVAFMIFGLILRGVSFDFRAKADAKYQHLWDRCFSIGSTLAAFSQGYMLGNYIIGFQTTITGIAFSCLIGLCMIGGYALNGACWLIFKTEGALQEHAVKWARFNLFATAIGAALVSAATPFVSPRIFARWFTLPNIYYLAPIPILTGILFLYLLRLLIKLPHENDKYSRLPFLTVIGIYILCFSGLAYSFFPFIIPDKLTIWQAASAPESLMFIFVGVCIVLPAIIGYTIFAYYVFRGKAVALEYY